VLQYQRLPKHRRRKSLKRRRQRKKMRAQRVRIRLPVVIRKLEDHLQAKIQSQTTTKSQIRRLQKSRPSFPVSLEATTPASPL
jgi:hypothetical protein